MFYCDACAEKNGWPITWISKSRGACEMCGTLATCNDRPSRLLPIPPAAGQEQKP